MYNHDRPISDRLQDFVSVLSTDKEETNKMNNNGSHFVDPLTERVLKVALGLLENCSKITIKDVVNACNLSDSPVRQRMALLTDAGKLEHKPGAGRKPAYYRLPNQTNFDKSNNEALDKIDLVVAIDNHEPVKIADAQISSFAKSSMDAVNELNTLLVSLEAEADDIREQIDRLAKKLDDALKKKSNIENVIKTIERQSGMLCELEKICKQT